MSLHGSISNEITVKLDLFNDYELSMLVSGC